MDMWMTKHTFVSLACILIRFFSLTSSFSQKKREKKNGKFAKCHEEGFLKNRNVGRLLQISVFSSCFFLTETVCWTNKPFVNDTYMQRYFILKSVWFSENKQTLYESEEAHLRCVWNTWSERSSSLPQRSVGSTVKLGNAF